MDESNNSVKRKPKLSKADKIREQIKDMAGRLRDAEIEEQKARLVELERAGKKAGIHKHDIKIDIIVAALKKLIPK